MAIPIVTGICDCHACAEVNRLARTALDSFEDAIAAMGTVEVEAIYRAALSLLIASCTQHDDPESARFRAVRAICAVHDGSFTEVEDKPPSPPDDLRSLRILK